MVFCGPGYAVVWIIVPKLSSRVIAQVNILGRVIGYVSFDMVEEEGSAYIE